LLKNADKYDFVITDIEMPNMNGIEMIKQFKSIHKNSSLPILFHSSISNPEFSKDLMVEGYGDMITKFNEETLYQSIINLFHKE
jgi:PleD family two-component response regulator